MTESADLRLYLIADAGLADHRALVEIVGAAVRGGVTCVQLRGKRLSTRELLDLAIELLATCRAFGVPFVVNDRVDVALAAGAHGAHVGHLGDEDLPPADARRLLGREAIVGVSVATPREVRAAEEAGVSYVSAGPMFRTATKDDAGEPLGAALLRTLRPATALPLVAIGGIAADQVAELLRAGADGVCVGAAIVRAADPAGEARRFRDAIESAAEEGRDGQGLGS